MVLRAAYSIMYHSPMFQNGPTWVALSFGPTIFSSQAKYVGFWYSGTVGTSFAMSASASFQMRARSCGSIVTSVSSRSLVTSSLQYLVLFSVGGESHIHDGLPPTGSGLPTQAKLNRSQASLLDRNLSANTTAASSNEALTLMPIAASCCWTTSNC